MTPRSSLDDPLELGRSDPSPSALWGGLFHVPLADRRFRRIVLLTLVMLLAHFALDYLQNSGVLPIEGFASDALLLFPVIYASVDFGIVGALGTALSGSVVILASEFVVRDTSHELSAEWTILAIIVATALVLGLIEDRLRDQRQFLELATRDAGTAVWEYDVERGAMRRSANHDGLYGLAWQRPWRLEAFLEATHPDDRNVSAAAIEGSVAPGGPNEYAFDFRVVLPDGSVRWLAVRGAVTARDESGRGRLVRGVLFDVTARQEQQRQLERLNVLYAALSECNQAVVRARDESDLFARIVNGVVNVGVADMAWVGLFDDARATARPVASAGRLAGEFLAEREVIRAHSTATWPATEAAQSGELVTRDVSLEDPDELSRATAARGWRSVVALPIRRRGSVVAALSLYFNEGGFSDQALRPLLAEMMMDLSFALDLFEDGREREVVQLELRDSEERFRAVVEQSVVGIYLVRDGRFVLANAKAASLLGYESASAMLGESASIIETVDGDVSSNDRSFLLESDRERVIDVPRPSGGVAHLWVSSAPIVERTGPTLLGVLDDVSALVEHDALVAAHLGEVVNLVHATVGVATSISELRDPYTAGHQSRVGAVAAAIGDALGLDADHVEGLRMAGQLHDLGKIAVPAEILTRPGRLNDMERRLIEQHPQVGYDILRDVPFTSPVALVALQHHERLDGSGYPQGLRDDEIVLDARIVAVADVIEAMSSHRPYRPSLGLDAAIAEVERGSGTRYDAAVVTAALRLARSGELPL
ncbi:MAG: HD domain-containing phosphohydrolase [Acidimicrobiales bacterium]